MSLRAATWAAVSTEKQAAEDKVSVDDQIIRSRERISMRGWRESKLYRLDGVSRTKWVSLYHAEKEIEELRDLIDCAERGEIDIVVVYHFNRFRSLLRQVFDVLADCGVQLVSITNWREPVAPDKYDEREKAAVGMLIDLHMLLSNNQLSTLQQQYQDKMPYRITNKGLPAGTGPVQYGYRKPAGEKFNRDAILEPDPVTSKHVIKMKDLFFRGVSVRKITQQLEEAGIPAPEGGKRWHTRVVTYILKSPYYAGIVTWGASKNQRNRRTGTSTQTKTTPISNKGKHKPLWDEATHLRILTEMERRSRVHGTTQTRQLSTLLYCWCGELIWIVGHTKKDFYWGCSSRKAKHFRENDSVLLPKFIEELKEELSKTPDKNAKSVGNNSELEKAQKDKNDILKKHKRWMDAFENEEIDGSEYSKRIKELKQEAETIQKKIDTLHNKAQRSVDVQSIIKGFSASIEFWPDWIKKSPPLEVNTELHSFIERVDIDKQGNMKIKLYLDDT